MVSELRLALEDKLPRYMTPSVFVKMDALPQTSSGKIDRNALPEPSKERPDLATEYVAPRTPAEQVLARMWSEVLNLDQVGIYDAFMNLGGQLLAGCAGHLQGAPGVSSGITFEIVDGGTHYC
jgi:hypothetical protein